MIKTYKVSGVIHVMTNVVDIGQKPDRTRMDWVEIDVDDFVTAYRRSEATQLAAYHSIPIDMIKYSYYWQEGPYITEI